MEEITIEGREAIIVEYLSTKSGINFFNTPVVPNKAICSCEGIFISIANWTYANLIRSMSA